MTVTTILRSCRSHEDATVASFARDPEYAAAYLAAVIEDGDGDEAERQLATARLRRAFEIPPAPEGRGDFGSV